MKNRAHPVPTPGASRNLSERDRTVAELSAVADDVKDRLASIGGSVDRLSDGLGELSTRFDLGGDADMATIVQDVVDIANAVAGGVGLPLQRSQPAGREALEAPIRSAQFRSTTAGVHSELGARELEVVRRMAGGMSNRAVADEMHISLNTVRNHVQSILYKLDVHSKLAAVAAAVATGMIEQGRPA